ncbi:glycosyltransferase family 87 protein [Edaphobacter bradus]|uniref:glycosyltransferase family 87 protein n=1 Tax=Edaphobacter bradus TaxID=2259016 RepID=UPI0021DFE0FE|nr:glycosyltransferase family 87 protein [Edaphobacter bradus]
MFLTKKRLRLYLGGLLILQVFTCLGCLPFLRGGFIDLRTFYTAGYMVRTEDAAHLYDYKTEQRLQSSLVAPDERALPMMSPAYTAILFTPLSLVRYRIAYLIFLAVNLLLLALAIATMRPHLDSLAGRWKPLPTLLFLSFLPAGIAWMMGQISFVLLLIYCLCYIALQNERPFIAGLFLSFALMKFQIALPVAFLFLAWRQWQFFVGFLVGTAGLTALSARVIGLANFIPYLRSLFFMSSTISASPYEQLKYSILPQRMPNLYGLFFSLSGGAHWGQILTILASILLLVWAIFQRPSLPFALLVGMLVSYHFYLYDLTLLLLPLCLIANRYIREDTDDSYPESSPLTRTGLVKWRRLCAAYSTAFLLIAPIERFLIASDLIYLLAIPVATLALTQAEWTSPRSGKPQASAEPPLAQLAQS